MAALTFNQTGHSYAPGAATPVWALQPMDMTWQNGRTYALVGPSGCGKTTLLNVVSGLVRPSQGRVLFDDRDVTDIPTAKRNIAQVFQFPVIYTSMSVYDNLAFPLVCRKWERQRIRAKVGEIAEVLGLSDRLKMSANGLTADVKQLISLGRGLVRDDVAAVLMDEPLTVIDPQLKLALRRKIREINERFDLTIVYVTHDQYEAMTFADEVLVMNNGQVVQQGSPEELFERPRTEYVGYFIGSPAMNFLDASARPGGFEVDGVLLQAASQPPAGYVGQLRLGIRPEYASLVDSSGPNTLPGTLLSAQDHGSSQILTVAVGGQVLKLKTSRRSGRPGANPLVHLPADKVLVYAGGELQPAAHPATAA